MSNKSEKNILKHEYSVFIAAYFSIFILCRMRLIGPTHFSSQFMEQHSSGVTTLKHAVCSPNVFLKIAEKPNNYQFYLPNFLKFRDKISHKLLRATQFLKKFLEILG